VRATTQDGKFELSVANAGEPIPSEAMERLFQPFYRVAEQGSQQGLGLGLTSPPNSRVPTGGGLT
jgi:sigma-B regulation protein RsbU (phosphoserine phosphatase)